MKTRILLPMLALLLYGCGVPIAIPTVGERPSYPGFDTWRYPGDDVMTIWRQSSPYRWMGYYLPAPCHRGTSFVGKRQFLTQTGWGIAVLYVGQQQFEGQTPAEITETTICSSRLLTAERGTIDGQDAIARTQSEGFPPGSVIFLDVERVDRLSPELIAYYQSWLRTVATDGRYRVGTYAHVANAAALYTVAQPVLQQAGITTGIPFWIAGGQGFSLDAQPERVGYRFAEIWQGVLDVNRTWGGRTVHIDENVARYPSPSAPRVP
jgi:hypothetical protein